MATKEKLLALKDVCEIAIVYCQVKGVKTSVIVYLTDEPSNSDLVNPNKHWYIYGSIDEFVNAFLNADSDIDVVLDVNPFVSDYETTKKGKKKTKVYVLVEDYSSDYELCVNVLLVTTDKKKAQDKLHETAESVKNAEDSLWDKDNPQFEDFHDDENDFSCWEDGSHACNHYTLTIHEKWLDT